MGSKGGARKKNRVFTGEFKRAALRRMTRGECVTALCRELRIRRGLLYRWREISLKRGPAALDWKPGRQCAAQANQSHRRDAKWRIAQLEQKVGQQTLAISFLKRAFKRVEEIRQSSIKGGGTASTRRSSE